MLQRDCAVFPILQLNDIYILFVCFEDIIQLRTCLYQKTKVHFVDENQLLMRIRFWRLRMFTKRTDKKLGVSRNICSKNSSLTLYEPYHPHLVHLITFDDLDKLVKFYQKIKNLRKICMGCFSTKIHFKWWRYFLCCMVMSVYIWLVYRESVGW